MKRNRLNKFTLFFLFALLDTALIAQTTYTSIQDGDWEDAETWGTKTLPASTDDVIINHLVSVGGGNAGSFIPLTRGPGTSTEINPGGMLLLKGQYKNDGHTIIHGTFEINTGGVLILEDVANSRLRVMRGGHLLIASMAEYSKVIKFAAATEYKSGLIDISDNGYVTVGKGENTTGAHYENIAVSAASRWETNAIFTWNNGKTFETNTTYFPSSGSNIPTFSIGPTPIPAITTAGNLFINGIFDVRTDVNFSAVTGSRTFRNGITGNSTLNIAAGSGGTQNITGNNAILGGSNLEIITGKVLNLEGTVTVPADSTVTISGANVAIDAGKLLTVNGTLDISDNRITNAGSRIKISGVFRSKNAGSTTWPLISVPSGSVELLPGSTIEMYAAGDQIFKSRDDFSNLVFSGSGTKTPSSGFNYEGIITINDEAIFDAKNYTIGDTDVSHLIMTGGRYRTESADKNPTIDGKYELTGGVVEFARRGLATYQSIRKVDFNRIEVTGNRVANSDGNIDLRDNGSFTVKEGGVFSITTNSIKGLAPSSASVIVESGGTFRTGNKKGFHGFESALGEYSSIHANIIDITLEPGSTVEYFRDENIHSDGEQLITNLNNLAYHNLVLSGVGNKTAPPGILIIKGDFSKLAGSVFKHNNGTVEFTNKLDPPTEFIPKEFNSVLPFPEFFNLVNNQNLQINNDLTVKNSLLLKEKSILNLATGDITISSDESGTAQVPEIPADASITYETGRFKVERFIPDHPKAWQLISVPAKGGTIKESWQNNQPTNFIAFKGVNITGPFSDWKQRGFDKQSPAPSMKFYSPEANLYEGILSTHDIISEHPAYFLFVRGDRSANDMNDPHSQVTIHTRGKLYAPEEPAPGLTVLPGKWALVGNPYASAIDFYSLDLSSNLETSYYIWDPNLTTDGVSLYGLGAYRKIELVDGKLTSIPDATPGAMYSEGNVPMIQSGQAFFVRNESGSDPGLITFSERAKTSGSENIFRSGSGNSSSSARIRTNLSINENEGVVLLDGTLHLFGNEYSIEIDRYDAKKMVNSGENIFLPSNKYDLIVERRPFPTEKDTLFYHLTNIQNRNYLLEVFLSNMETTGHEIYFTDSYLNSSTPLFNGKNKIDFAVDNNLMSGKKDRFYLTFKKIISPFTFKNKKAVAAEETIIFSWEAFSQENVRVYIIEYSPDGKTFHSIHQLHSTSREMDKYQFDHRGMNEGMHFYRVKAILKDSTTFYSKVVSAEIQFTSPSISIFPNPVEGHLNLKYNRQPKGKYAIRIINPAGKQIISKIITHSEKSAVHKINLSLLSSGFYNLEITKPDGSKYSGGVIVR